MQSIKSFRKQLLISELHIYWLEHLYKVAVFSSANNDHYLEGSSVSVAAVSTHPARTSLIFITPPYSSHTIISETLTC